MDDVYQTSNNTLAKISPSRPSLNIRTHFFFLKS